MCVSFLWKSPVVSAKEPYKVLSSQKETCILNGIERVRMPEQVSFLWKSPVVPAKKPYKDYTSTSSQPTKRLVCLLIKIALQSCVSFFFFLLKSSVTSAKSPAISAKEPYKHYTSTSSQPTRRFACLVITIALQSCAKEPCYFRKRALPYVQKSPVKATHRRVASPRQDLQALSSQLLCSRVYRFLHKSPVIFAKEPCHICKRAL